MYILFVNIKYKSVNQVTMPKMYVDDVITILIAT